jgi:hypothetical protein
VLTFLYQAPAGFSPREMFCNTGSVIMKASNFTESEVTCMTRIEEGSYDFVISFDSYHWSDENVTVEVGTQARDMEIVAALPFLMVMTGVLGVGIVLHYGSRLFFAAN